MTNQTLGSSQNQKPVEGYRGIFLYRQVSGYTLITMIVNLYTPDDDSFILIWSRDRETLEYGNHLQRDAFDLYHFWVIDGDVVDIELTVMLQEGVDTAYYTIGASGVEDLASDSLWLEVVKIPQ
jgi:hypothetical protein